ncbi:uncharacterized protein LOC117106721 [Anneissia japonica]|uniref:uncharacterized protein LOC117106721 n=1 Tax=Anneissia japonica TaxID=1529436 RepID=UPI0014256CED|nr:uncharacterized protein LOC117106721 [Anneissia japonica]
MKWNMHRAIGLYLTVFMILMCGELCFSSDVCPGEYYSCHWECPTLTDSCPGNRIISDPCACCNICAKQAGEPCLLPSQACDYSFGLFCINGTCSGKYNLQVISGTATSINLRWNDFKPKDSKKAFYLVYYTDKYDDNTLNWNGQIQVKTGTYVSVKNLKTDTDYYFKVTYRIQGNGVQLEGPSSETALHTAGAPTPWGGCEHDGKHFDEGQTIKQSCDAVCDCLLSSWLCRPRACPPTPDVVFDSKKNCREVPHPDDPGCCIIIQCDDDEEDEIDVEPRDCFRDGVRHKHGQTYYYDCDEVCYCDDGQETCAPRCQEPGTMLPDPDTCPHPKLNDPSEGECCPYWSCPPPPGYCEMNGNTYAEDEFFDVDCSMRCQCMNGYINCYPRCSHTVRPPSADCPNPKKVRIPGECCMQWECVDIEPKTCVYMRSATLNNITLADGEWIDEGCDSRCHCTLGEVTCMPLCDQLETPIPTPLCPAPVITKVKSTDCCQVVACNDPDKPSPNAVQDVTVYAINSSAITIGFAPPTNPDLRNILDGYHIYYTDQSEEENIEKWLRYRQDDIPDGFRMTGHTIVQINNLRRQATYYIRIKVTIPESVVTQWHNTLPATDTIVIRTNEKQPQPCHYRGKIYEHNKTFNIGCESTCECKFGQTVCRARCQKVDLLPSTDCPSPRQIYEPGQCCPTWQCFPNDGDCRHNGTIYKDGMEWRYGCDVRCECKNSKVQCRNVCTNGTQNLPVYDCKYPVQISVPDTCCKEWVCYEEKPPTHMPLPSLPLPLSSFIIEITAHDINAREAVITWPILTDVQRQFISLFRLKYRELGYDVRMWNSSIEFRPELIKYTLVNLKPSRSYVVQLVVILGEIHEPGIALELQTNKVEIDTLWVPAEPYPGEPIDIEVLSVNLNTITLKWEALPQAINVDLIGWRLTYGKEEEPNKIKSKRVKKSALSYVLRDLAPSQAYKIQLIGLWDNGTLTREVRSKIISETTKTPNTTISTGIKKGSSTVGVAVGMVILAVILIVAIVVLYVKVIRPKTKRQYDVYVRTTKINYDNTSTYDQISKDVRRGSEAGLLDVLRRGSEGAFLDLPRGGEVGYYSLRRDSEATFLSSRRGSQDGLLDL